MKSSTWGKVLGAVGLVLLLSSPYTYFITTGQPLLSAMKALMGVVLVGAFLATNFRNLGQFASGRSTFFFVSSALISVATLGALVAVNYIAAKKDKSWDLTKKKIFTLAPQTSSTLKGLKEKVTAIGFLDSSNPNYDLLEGLFQRFQREAPDKFTYIFRSPQRNPDLAAKYQLKEGQTTVVLARGTGAQETHTALNVVSEQELTNALIKLNAVGEQKVYFVVGHGEWPLEAQTPEPGEEGGTGLSEMKKDLLQDGYAPESINLAGKSELPTDAATVIIAGSKNAIEAPEVAVLRKYLSQGGRMLYFAESTGNPGPAMDKLLEDYGIKVDPGIVADDKFAVSSPYVIVSMFYGEHEITRLLKQMQLNIEFPLSRGLTVLKAGLPAGLKTDVVLTTSPYAWEELNPNDSPQRSDGEKTGQIPLVAASTQGTASATNKRFDEARVVVFGDSQILIDANWGHEANRNLVLNSLGWVSNQVAKITIRPPDRDISTLDIDKPMMAKIRFFATDLLPLSLLGIGLAIWLARRDK